MRTPDPKINTLRSVPGLDHYPEKVLARLAPLFDEATVPAGTILARAGEHGREAFLVVSGEAVATRLGETIGTIGPGEFAGELSMLDHRPRMATVRAVTEMRLLVVGPDGFARAINALPLLRRMLSDVARRSRPRDAGGPRVPATPSAPAGPDQS